MNQPKHLVGRTPPKGFTNIVNSIKRRRHCNPRCAIFDVCPMMPLSMSRANVDTSCLLNKGGNVLIRRFINLMVKGEDGILNEINNTLYSYAHDIEVAPPSVKRDYAMMCLKLHDQLYCKKAVEQMERPALTVVINEMGADGRIREIVPIIDDSHIPLQHGKSKMLADAVKSIRTEDPESLFDSPIVEEILHVQKPNNRAKDDEPVGTEGKPEELAETPGRTEDRT